MKGFIFSLAVIFLSAPALADEQIKLAQVIGSGGAVTPANDTESTPAATETTASSATGSYVAVGILIAASIGVIAGTSSSSSH